MLFPKFAIDEIRKQENRDLTRFDLYYVIPDHFLPPFPLAIFLTTRTDLGDVSQGKLVTIENYYELFNGILNPKQLEGLRLLVTPFAQQQFSQVHFMAEFQEILDFPPAPKLNFEGKLDPSKANEAELRGQNLFLAKLNVLFAIHHLIIQITACII